MSGDLGERRSSRVDTDFPSKVLAVQLNGYKTTCYLEREHEDGTFTGVKKHSDEPIRVRWVEESKVWVEVEDA